MTGGATGASSDPAVGRERLSGNGEAAAGESDSRDNGEPAATGEQAGVGPVGALFSKLGGEILEATPERCVARIPVEGNTQPLGYLHGGATAALAETVASVGAWVASGGQPTFGIEIKVNHMRSLRSGWITATGLPLHVGRSTQVWEVRVHDDDGRLIAFSTCTLATRAPRPEAQ
jgi:uncharacterized protein (TIGR00369 family)